MVVVVVVVVVVVEVVVVVMFSRHHRTVHFPFYSTVKASCVCGCGEFGENLIPFYINMPQS